MKVAVQVSPLAVSLFFALPSLAQQTVTLQESSTYAGTSDARIVCCADTNEGSALLFDLIPDTTTSVLIKFKIFTSEGGPVPDGSAIQSATLAIYRNDGPASIFAVHRVLRAWDEGTVSWLNTGASGAWSGSGGAFPPDIASTADSQVTMPDSTGCPADPPAPANCWFRFDVTASVGAFSTNQAPNNGWKLRYVSDTDGTQTNSHTPKEFYSSENTRGPEMRPTLTVTWQAAPTPKTATAVPLYGMYRASNTDWLYTTDANERSTAINSLGYADNGIAGYCDPADNGAGAPLYRFWKGPPQNEHFYTTDPAEKDSVIAGGYTFEGVQCWVWPTQVAGTTAFYRMEKFDGATGDLVHFYTTDTNAVTQKQSEGYTLEGVQAYIQPPPPPGGGDCSAPGLALCIQFEPAPDTTFSGSDVTSTSVGGNSVVWAAQNAAPDSAVDVNRVALVSGGRDGSTAIKLQTLNNDSGVHGSGDWERSELELSVADSATAVGTDSWWAHSLYVPVDAALPSATETQVNLFQFHGNIGSAPNFALSMINQTGTNPHKVFRAYSAGGATNSNDGMGTQYSYVIDGATRIGQCIFDDFEQGVWYDFVHHIRWASDGTGRHEIWMRKAGGPVVKVLDRAGINTVYTGDSPFLKIGVYHSPVLGANTSAIHDRIRRGTSADAVRMPDFIVDPAAPVTWCAGVVH